MKFEWRLINEDKTKEAAGCSEIWRNPETKISDLKKVNDERNLGCTRANLYARVRTGNDFKLVFKQQFLLSTGEEVIMPVVDEEQKKPTKNKSQAVEDGLIFLS